MTCLNENKCLSIPPINDPKTDPWFNKCLAPEQIKPAKSLNQTDLSGGWWAALGFHPIYDCSFACQHTWLTELNATHLDWKVSMQQGLVNGSLRLLDEVWPFPRQSGNQFWLNHTDLGMKHIEHWTLLDAADDGAWVTLYYCGQTGSWKYSGGIAFSRARTLTAAPPNSTAAKAFDAVVFQPLPHTGQPLQLTSYTEK